MDHPLPEDTPAALAAWPSLPSSSPPSAAGRSCCTKAGGWGAAGAAALCGRIKGPERHKGGPTRPPGHTQPHLQSGRMSLSSARGERAGTHLGDGADDANNVGWELMAKGGARCPGLFISCPDSPGCARACTCAPPFLLAFMEVDRFY